MIKLPITSCLYLWPFSSYCISQLTKNTEVLLLINCLAQRGVLVMGNVFPIKKQLTRSWSSCDFAMPSLGVENQATSIGMTGPSFPDYSHRPWIYLRYDLLEDIWFIGCNLNQVISNCSMMFLLLWWQKSWNEFCHDTFHVKILCQNLRHSSFWNLQISF